MNIKPQLVFNQTYQYSYLSIDVNCFHCEGCECALYVGLTVVVNLVRVWYQATVVWSRWYSVWDPIVVIVIVTLVTQPVFVSVQLGAIDHIRAIILGILVTVAITTGEVT